MITGIAIGALAVFVIYDHVKLIALGKKVVIKVVAAEAVIKSDAAKIEAAVKKV